MASKRAQRRRFHRSSCSSKVRYASRAAANAGLKRLVDSKGFLGYMHVYPCALCQGFHFGHPTKRYKHLVKKNV